MKSAKRTLRARWRRLAFDDGFRLAVTSLPLLPALLIGSLLSRSDINGAALLVTTVGGGLALALVLNLCWTHWLYTRTDPRLLERIARYQWQHGPSQLSRFMGAHDAQAWSLSLALVSLVVAIGLVLTPWDSPSALVPALVIVTAAASWVSVGYTFALQYFRLNAAGEHIDFDIREAPDFGDFLSMALMVSAAGAYNGGTPRTRQGLRTIRTHTYVAFLFNTAVLAMIISLISGSILG
ncbi:hypothetical protein GCM10027417_24840 [Glutamicibacter endophyticus]|uniref:DUF1345 domain-containing protein n=1 Tax=Glutamicibacter sp. PS TaxID=3075634 RepID=UPI0028455C1B|nr:DUF1345 domain-containing protein [Glutamicibacter sp. PS]MDR4534979.1 DUF1345 domain-containing protein [Glutamicibacter sp. PS]